MAITEIEKSVIGAVIITNGQLLDEIALKPQDFYGWAHQDFWKILTDRQKAGEPLDPVTLLASYPKLAEQIHEYLDACYHPDLAKGHAEQVKLAANKRLVHETAQRVVNLSLAESIELLNKTLDDVDSGTVTDYPYVKDLFDDHLKSLREPNRNPRSGLAKVDELLQGFKPGGLYVIGARPGVGKTVVGLQIAWNLARHGNALSENEEPGTVLFHSLEMSKGELLNRLIAYRASEKPNNTLTLADLERHKFDQSQERMLNEVKKELATSQLIINDEGSQSIASIRAFARHWERKHKPRAIVIDYLGLLSDSNEGKSRYEAITAISGGLKRLAKDLNLPVIVLAQLNRASVNRGDKMPILADLRDSGSVEQDADVVVLLHRDPTQSGEDLVFTVAKNRHGAVGNIQMVFYGQYAKIEEAKTY